MSFYKKIKFVFLLLLVLLPTIILPSFASYHQTANIQNENLKNKKVSYKEIRERKHSKNKSNLKTQVITSGLVLNLDATNIDNMSNAASGTTSTTTWTDLSGSGNNGTLANFANLNPSASNSGWDGVNTSANPSILKFDGLDDYVDVGDIGILNYGTTTISAWIYRDSSSASWIAATDPATGSQSGKFFWSFNLNLQMNGAGGVVAPGAICFSAGKIWNGNFAYYTDTSAIPLNRWTNVAAVWNGTSGSGNGQIYINGSPYTTLYSQEGGFSSPSNYDSVKIGGTSYFAGSIANVRIYNTALTANQISQNYSAEVGSFRNDNVVISSATINGAPQPIASSYQIKSGETLLVDVSGSDFSGNQVSLSSNPSVGMFSPVSALNAAGRFEFTPDATNVGTTSTITIRGVTNSGRKLSGLSFSVSVICGTCTSNNVCIGGVCCMSCPYSTLYCSTDMLCNAALIPATPPPLPATLIQTPVITSTATATPAATSTPSPTTTPVQNITNSGSSTSPQGPNILQPTVSSPLPAPSNATPQTQPNTFTPEQAKAIDTFVHSTMLIDFSQINEIKKNMPVNKPPAVKPDSAPYIDLSKDGKQ